jgi:hypothetical protein
MNLLREDSWRWHVQFHGHTYIGEKSLGRSL